MFKLLKPLELLVERYSSIVGNLGHRRTSSRSLETNHEDSVAYNETLEAPPPGSTTVRQPLELTKLEQNFSLLFQSTTPSSSAKRTYSDFERYYSFEKSAKILLVARKY